MKLTKQTFVFSLLILLLASCSGNNNTPEAVALSFTKDIYTANFDKTKKVCTEEAKKVMDMFPAMKVSEKAAFFFCYAARLLSIFIFKISLVFSIITFREVILQK